MALLADEAEQAFNEAMTRAQAEMRPVARDANNPQTRSKYASYVALDRALRPSTPPTTLPCPSIRARRTTPIASWSSAMSPTGAIASATKSPCRPTARVPGAMT